MKHINEYLDNKIINEGLLDWFKAFFKKLYKNQRSRVSDNNKVEMYKVDTKNMKVQKEAVKLNDVDKDTQEIWNDKQVGFPIGSLIKANPRKYQLVKDKEFNPDVLCYFSQDKNATYIIGLLIVDKDISFIENYQHIVDIESSLIVDNPTDVNKAIIEEYSELVKKENSNFKGFTAKEIHPKLKGNLVKLGFKRSDNDKEILIYNIK